MNLEKVKKLNIPTGPGSYQYYDQSGKIIYIGKAANLRARVLSYWHESAEHTPAKELMVKKIAKIKWVETDTEIEALLLEANLVKKYQPRYNIDLKDDKRHSYIKISLEDQWPRVFLTREIAKQGKYFGPFLSAESVKEVLKIIRYIWPFRSCATMPKRACLYYRIGKCPGMCEFKVSREEYLKNIGEIEKFLAGKKKEVEKNLEFGIWNLEREKRSGEEENKLNILKYRLFNLKKVLENSRILTVGEKYAADVIELAKTLKLPKIPQRIEGYDISNIFGREAVGSMVVFAAGEPDKNEYRKFTIRGNADQNTPRPRGAATPLNRGDFATKQFIPLLPAPQSEAMRGRGVPSPARRGVLKSDDTAMLKEVLERRFHNRPTPENGGAGWPLPDLIIIDGGKGQLNAGLAILKKIQGELRSKRGCPGAKLDIPIIAISKGEGLRSAHAPDKIFFPGMKTPLVLPLASPSLHIIKRVRDEAHRFAIGFHRQRRSANWLKK
ncbi:MAG: excinuclease ABC subunit UvrC [Patescibacteria group bacterium]|nr:excinuclease ABC subunit UvrC [Patescibacteria group bacterium]